MHRRLCDRTGLAEGRQRQEAEQQRGGPPPQISSLFHGFSFLVVMFLK
jgi:hypothetical protein